MSQKEIKDEVKRTYTFHYRRCTEESVSFKVKALNEDEAFKIASSTYGYRGNKISDDLWKEQSNGYVIHVDIEFMGANYD